MNEFEVKDGSGWKDESRNETGVAVVEDKAMMATVAEQRRDDRSMLLNCHQIS